MRLHHLEEGLSQTKVYFGDHWITEGKYDWYARDYVKSMAPQRMKDLHPIARNAFLRDLDKTYPGLRKELGEGTWAWPDQVWQVKELNKLMSSPLSADTATDQLYDLIGDDELYDDLEDAKRMDPKADVRPIVVRRLKNMGIIESNKELTEWDWLPSWKKWLKSKFGSDIIGSKVDRSRDVHTIDLPVGNLQQWIKEDPDAAEKVDTLTKMQKAYKHNEDRNAHSENILMLVHAFGDRGEIKAVEGLIKTIRQQGYTTPEQSELMYNAIHKKYFRELFPLNEIWPALAIGGLAGYGLYKAGQWMKNKHKQVATPYKDSIARTKKINKELGEAGKPQYKTNHYTDPDGEKYDCMNCGHIGSDWVENDKIKDIGDPEANAMLCPNCHSEHYYTHDDDGKPENIQGPLPVTKRDPLVTIWDRAESKEYPEQGILGHMNLSTAGHIHGFKISNHIANQLAMAGTGTRIKVSNKVWAKHGDGVYLEYSNNNPGNMDEAVTIDKDDKLASLKVHEPSESSYTLKQIKMAFGVLNDPRYKDGNYDGAVAVIEKIAKGLSDHPSVAKALKRVNEAPVGKTTGYAPPTTHTISNRTNLSAKERGDGSQVQALRSYSKSYQHDGPRPEQGLSTMSDVSINKWDPDGNMSSDTYNRFIMPGGAGVATGPDGVEKNIQMKGPQSWAYDRPKQDNNIMKNRLQMKKIGEDEDEKDKKSKDKKSSDLKGFDAKTQQSLATLQAKYPHADNLISAMAAQIDQTLQHQDKGDEKRDNRDKEQDIRFQELESRLLNLIIKNDLEESSLNEIDPSRSPWTISGKHPGAMNDEELQIEIEAIEQQVEITGSSPTDLMRLDALYNYLSDEATQELEARRLYNTDEDITKESIIEALDELIHVLPVTEGSNEFVYDLTRLRRAIKEERIDEVLPLVGLLGPAAMAAARLGAKKAAQIISKTKTGQKAATGIKNWWKRLWGKGNLKTKAKAAGTAASMGISGGFGKTKPGRKKSGKWDATAAAYRAGLSTKDIKAVQKGFDK